MPGKGVPTLFPLANFTPGADDGYASAADGYASASEGYFSAAESVSSMQSGSMRSGVRPAYTGGRRRPSMASPGGSDSDEEVRRRLLHACWLAVSLQADVVQQQAASLLNRGVIPEDLRCQTSALRGQKNWETLAPATVWGLAPWRSLCGRAVRRRAFP